MPRKDARVDAYIKKSAPFAQPILKKIRTTWHKACPDIEETIKWSIPYFQKNGLVGGMAAFKAHVSLGFWKAKEMGDPEEILGDGSGMCAAKMTSIDDLPSEQVLLDYMREAVALNDAGPAKEKRARKAVKVPDMPPDFQKALQRKRKALAEFEKFAPSRRKEYIEWIVQAKQPATRERRIAQAVEWIAEGKPRHWKHMK
ncbi:MAG TPA: YdeI/OmpD-associated family protein [Woeseiaceae bacterium]|nr:YdeI/OmpD-associated family protein [Woeseiaceae bacterium]